MATPNDDCTTCCVCPQPSTRWDFALTDGSACGYYVDPDQMPAGSGSCSNYFRTKRLDVSLLDGTSSNTWSGERTYAVGSVNWSYDEVGCEGSLSDSWGGTTNIIPNPLCSGHSGAIPGDDFGEPFQRYDYSDNYYTPVWFIDRHAGECFPNESSENEWEFSEPTYTSGPDDSVIHSWTPLGATGYFKVHYENPIDPADILTAFLAREPVFSGEYTSFPSVGRGSFTLFDECGMGGSLVRMRYQFHLPHVVMVGARQLYRLTWVERVMPFWTGLGDDMARGISVDSLEIKEPGDYRPRATVAAPPFGGMQIHVAPIMSASGAVASLNILNPGAGYADGTLPVSIQSTEGWTPGTSATGWSLTISGGQAIAAVPGTGGDYLPRVFVDTTGFGAPTPTTEAVIAVTMSPMGGIDTATITNGGDGYFAGNGNLIMPFVRISSPSWRYADAVIFEHMGTEVQRCYSFDIRFTGTVLAPPEGYFSILTTPEVSGYVCGVANVYGECNNTTACP